ncbi:hypothetical protein JNUCC0626_18470 [Lentzea sp. JNUCC 0626]|uniref:hypothetical protein n=1 Tax=Lentzea sp. JNUCC 0626 TaxID=3367513 RepID=UPI0037483E92
MTEATKPTPRRNGTGLEWTAPAQEAQRILGDRVEAGVNTWADHVLAALFQTLAAPEPATLLAALDDLHAVTSAWSADVKDHVATADGHAATFSPWEGSKNTTTGLPLVDWECTCGMSDHGFLDEAEARADWEAHTSG